MALPSRAATIKVTAAAMAAQRGPIIPHYNFPLDLGVHFEFIPGNIDAIDSITVFGNQGGTPGRWRRVRMPLLGANLGDVDVTVDPQGNYIRQLPAATLTLGRTITMGTTNARSGDIITIVRLDTTANTLTIVNGGLGAGTLLTMPVSVEAFADLYFNGTNWIKLRAATML